MFSSASSLSTAGMNRRSSLIIGLLLLALGVYVTLGWLLGDEAMVRLFKESVPTRLNTALGFILLGGAFVLMALPPSPWQGRAVRLAALPVTVAAVAFMLENLLNVDFGIDFAAFHPDFYPDNPRPGLVPLNSSMAFMLSGCAFFALTERRKSHFSFWLIRLLGLLVLGICAASMVANVLQLNPVYRIGVWNQMAIMAGAGFALTGAGIWLYGRQAAEDSVADVRTDFETRITYTAAVIMTVLALVSGLCGFTILKGYADETLQAQLRREVQAGVAHIIDNLDQQHVLAAGLAAQPEFATLLAAAPHDPAAADRLAATAKKFLPLGYDRIAFYDPQGKLVAEVGIPDLASTASSDDPLYELPVGNTDRADTLQWYKGFFLKSVLPLASDGAAVGSMLVEQDMRALTQSVRDIQNSRQTSDAALCAHGAGDTLHCLPSRTNPAPGHYPMYRDGKATFPMVHALLGESGVMSALNVRNIPILAAYQPVGSTGLGFVVRIETSELYGVIRPRIHLLLGLILVLVAAGAVLLRYQVAPLAARLATSEKAARLANDALMRDSERLSQVISTQDMITSASFDLDQIMQKSVDRLNRLTGATGTVIEMLKGDELYYRATSGALETARGIRVKVAGSLSGVCIRERDIINCPDTAADQRVDRAAVERLNIRSMMLAPLVHEGEALGVLKITSDRPGAFGDAESHTLKLLSGLIGSAIGKQIDYDAKQKLLVERTHMAQHDMLTGLPNRALFLDRLSTAILRAGRSDKAMALLFLDLDGFKQVNDTKGHRAGDEVLCQFARRLQAVVRKTDVVARLAGDEFTVILEGLTDPVENVNHLAKKLLATTQELFRLPTGDVFLGVSIGAVINHRDATSVDELLHKADQEMYKAKKAGKNRCSILGAAA